MIVIIISILSVISTFILLACIRVCGIADKEMTSFKKVATIPGTVSALEMTSAKNPL